MSPRILAAGLLVLCSIGCGDKPDADSEDAPDIAVSTAAIDFGEVSAAEGASESLLIENTGAEDLSIESVYLTYGESTYTVQSLSTQTVPPGGSVGLTVDFLPTDSAAVTDTLVIVSDDPDEALVEISLSGSGLLTGLSAPDSVDLGEVLYGCSGEAGVAVENTSSDPLTVESVSLSDESVFAVSVAELPVLLEPGESLTAWLTYTPDDVAAHSATLTLVSDSSASPTTTVAVVGEGTSAGSVVDTFTEPSAPIDLLFFADQSCSMDDNNALLGASFAAFAGTLDDMGLDWQAAAITQDSGCYNDLVSSDTVDIARDFEDALSAGSYGTYTEALLTMLNSALSTASAGGCNEDMVRPGGIVHAVMFSDEPEQSSGSWSSHVFSAEDHIDTLGASTLVINAIAGDVPGGCSAVVNGRTVRADAGTGYYEAVEATGGSFFSICGDYEEHLAALADTLATLTAVTLEQHPIEGTIAVSVDGTALTSGWSYDADSNTVTFDEAPAGGATVEVAYEALGECE